MTNYEILGVFPTDSEEVIKSAYRKLSKRYHPDIIGGDGKKFMQIKEAYEALMNPSRRVEGDSWINVTSHMYDGKKNTMDLHISHSNDFLIAEGTFGNKTAAWVMVNRTKSIIHISNEYMMPSFQIKFVNKDLSTFTKGFDFDIPKKQKKPDMKVKVETKSSSSNSCIGCIGQVIILWIIIEVIKYFFNIK